MRLCRLRRFGKIPHGVAADRWPGSAKTAILCGPAQPASVIGPGMS
jgi:hypothetical protein